MILVRYLLEVRANAMDVMSEDQLLDNVRAIAILSKTELTQIFQTRSSLSCMSSASVHPTSLNDLYLQKHGKRNYSR
jgi:hypothetical protein